MIGRISEIISQNLRKQIKIGEARRSVNLSMQIQIYISSLSELAISSFFVVTKTNQVDFVYYTDCNLY